MLKYVFSRVSYYWRDNEITAQCLSFSMSKLFQCFLCLLPIYQKKNMLISISHGIIIINSSKLLFCLFWNLPFETLCRYTLIIEYSNNIAIKCTRVLSRASHIPLCTPDNNSVHTAQFSEFVSACQRIASCRREPLRLIFWYFKAKVSLCADLFL